MKTRAILNKIFFVGLTVLLSSCNNDMVEMIEKKNPISDKDLAIFGIESGIVEITYDTLGSKDVLYFDRWGKRRAIYQYKSYVEGNRAKLRFIDIKDGSMSCAINPEDKTGIKTTMPPSIDPDIGNTLGLEKERQLKLLSNVKVGTDTVAGKICDVWDLNYDGAVCKTYLYKGIILKETRMKDGEFLAPVSVKIEENVKVPEEKFAIPAGTNISENGEK